MWDGGDALRDGKLVEVGKNERREQRGQWKTGKEKEGYRGGDGEMEGEEEKEREGHRDMERGRDTGREKEGEGVGRQWFPQFIVTFTICTFFSGIP